MCVAVTSRVFVLVVVTHRYKRTLELAPDDVRALNNLGTALHLQGQLDESVKYFRRYGVRPLLCFVFLFLVLSRCVACRSARCAYGRGQVAVVGYMRVWAVDGGMSV